MFGFLRSIFRSLFLLNCDFLFSYSDLICGFGFGDAIESLL